MPIYHRRSTVKPIATINLTSLLDVTFLLLLAFMIVAPTLRTGLTIDLPKVEESRTLTPRKSFTIVLQKPSEAGGRVRMYLENKRVDMKELRSRLEDLRDRYAPDLDILIEPDREVPCEPLLKVLALTQDVGIESVAVVTEREKK